MNKGRDPSDEALHRHPPLEPHLNHETTPASQHKSGALQYDAPKSLITKTSKCHEKPPVSHHRTHSLTQTNS
jgi:hypothetical protein